MSNQFILISLECLVPQNHSYRKFASIFNHRSYEYRLQKCVGDSNYKGYGISRLFKCLLLQFMENLSDRELERFLKENNSAKWFCGFELTDEIPNHTVFSRTRKKIGVDLMSKIFDILRTQLQLKGYVSEVFTFVDASHLVSKANLWQERDALIKAKLEQNNETISDVAHDKDAKIGCKGGNKFWYGYKKHVSVDMQSGMINRVSVTPANVSDADGLELVCPDHGAVYADKGYCGKKLQEFAESKNIHLAAIKRNNMKLKNKVQDSFISRMRSPYERVFSQQRRRVRYCGLTKNQFAEFMNAICFNLKRLLVVSPPDSQRATV